MSRVSVRMLAMILTVMAAAVACRAGSGAAVPAPVVDETKATAPAKQTAVVAGGCFWGIQAVFQHVKGVVSATSGYAGGSMKNPDYETVSSGRTGHAESVQIVYDPSKVSYGELLRVFFSVALDPTEVNRQGPDEGTQYRSVIFYGSDEQRKLPKLILLSSIRPNLSQEDCHAGDAVAGVLSRGGLSPELCDGASQRSLYCLQRCAEGCEFAEGTPGDVEVVRGGNAGPSGAKVRSHRGLISQRWKSCATQNHRGHRTLQKSEGFSNTRESWRNYV